MVWCVAELPYTTGPNARVCWTPKEASRKGSLSWGDPDSEIGLKCRAQCVVRGIEEWRIKKHKCQGGQWKCCGTSVETSSFEEETHQRVTETSWNMKVCTLTWSAISDRPEDNQVIRVYLFVPCPCPVSSCRTPILCAGHLCFLHLNSPWHIWVLNA